MTDNTTDTLRMSMRQIVDMTPAAPGLPAVPERRSVPRPMLALAYGFAAVLLFVGVGAALLADSGAETSRGVGAQPSTSSVPVAVVDSPIVVVFFETGPTDPSPDAVARLGARPEVEEVLIVDTVAAEAEVRRGLPDGETMWTADPGFAPSVRLRVTGDDAVVAGLTEFAAELDGVTHVDAYVGVIGVYPLWSYQGSTVGGVSVEGNAIVEESSIVTTTSIATTP